MASGSVITSVIVCVLKQTCFVFKFPHYIAISRGHGIIVRIYIVTAVAQHCTRAAITPRRSRNIPGIAGGVAMEFHLSVITIFIRTTPQASEIYLWLIRTSFMTVLSPLYTNAILNKYYVPYQNNYRVRTLYANWWCCPAHMLCPFPIRLRMRCAGCILYLPHMMRLWPQSYRKTYSYICSFVPPIIVLIKNVRFYSA